MPFNKFKGHLFLALVVLLSATGQWHGMTARLPANTVSAKAAGQHIEYKQVAARSSKQTATAEKRHKRVLPGQAWQQAVSFTFIKRYRLVELPVDYSSPHLIQRHAFVFSLRGPPAVA